MTTKHEREPPEPEAGRGNDKATPLATRLGGASASTHARWMIDVVGDVAADDTDRRARRPRAAKGSTFSSGGRGPVWREISPAEKSNSARRKVRAGGTGRANDTGAGAGAGARADAGAGRHSCVTAHDC